MSAKSNFSWKFLVGGIAIILAGIFVLNMNYIMVPECGSHSRANSLCTGPLYKVSFDSSPEVKWFTACIFFLIGTGVALAGTPLDCNNLFGNKKKDKDL